MSTVDQSAKSPSTPLTFTDQMRGRVKFILDPIAGFLNRIGLTPNIVTMLGLAGATLGAYFLAIGQISLGGIIIFVMAPIDALDGAMARLRGEPTIFGAFIDSVTDRYAELVTFGGILLHLSQQGDWLPVFLAYAAAAGSVLVSYTRARAQALGIDTKIGMLSRMERYLVLGPALIFNQLFIGLAILAIFTNITAVQRILDVRRQLRQRVQEKQH